MNTEFDKQLAVCRHYRRKCDFWQRIQFWELVAALIAHFMDWGIICWGLLIVFVVLYIPSCVRLYQYARAVNKLGEL